MQPTCAAAWLRIAEQKRPPDGISANGGQVFPLPAGDARAQVVDALNAAVDQDFGRDRAAVAGGAADQDRALRVPGVPNPIDPPKGCRLPPPLRSLQRERTASQGNRTRPLHRLFSALSIERFMGTEFCVARRC
jgi:hypothetical protein